MSPLTLGNKREEIELMQGKGLNSGAKGEDYLGAGKHLPKRKRRAKALTVLGVAPSGFLPSICGSRAGDRKEIFRGPIGMATKNLRRPPVDMRGAVFSSAVTVEQNPGGPVATPRAARDGADRRAR